jgi:hypothetical protein
MRVTSPKTPTQWAKLTYAVFSGCCLAVEAVF